MLATNHPPVDASHAVGATCFVVPGALSPERCRALCQEAQRRGFRSPSAAYPPSYRTNERLVVDDPSLAAGLEVSLAAYLPSTWRGDDGLPWPVSSINERVRFCRYREGQWFSRHRDGVFHRTAQERSALTIMVYLNDDFEGGHTRFFAGPHDRTPTWRYRPRAGSLIVFDHRLWHDGAPVTVGTKLVLRSDLMVTGPAPSPLAPGSAGLGSAGLGAPLEQHRGYVWSAVAGSDGTVITSGRDRTLRRWRAASSGYHLAEVWPTGHPSSRALALDGEGRPWSGSRDGTIRRWSDGGAGPCWRAHGGAVLSLVGHAGAMWSAGADGRIRRWSGPARLEATLQGHEGWVWALASNGDALWSAGEDGTLRRWRGGRGEVLFRARGPLRSLVALGAEAVAVGSADGVLRVFRGGRLVWRRRGHRGAVTALAVTCDGHLISGGEDGAVLTWAGRRPRELRRHGDFVTGLLPLGGELLSVGYDGARLSRAPSPTWGEGPPRAAEEPPAPMAVEARAAPTTPMKPVASESTR